MVFHVLRITLGTLNAVNFITIHHIRYSSFLMGKIAWEYYGIHLGHIGEMDVNIGYQFIVPYSSLRIKWLITLQNSRQN